MQAEKLEDERSEEPGRYAASVPTQVAPGAQWARGDVPLEGVGAAVYACPAESVSAAAIGALCRRTIVVSYAQEPLFAAAELLRSSDAACIVVCDNARPVGVIRQRDIVVSVLRHGVGLDALLLGQVMPEDQLVLRNDVDIDAAIDRMRAHRVRLAAVVSASGALVGAIALDDLIDARLARLTDGLANDF